MLVGVSGYIGSGKDSVVRVWQSLDWWYNEYGNRLIENENYNDIQFVETILTNDTVDIVQTSWSNKKFASKLKEICAVLFDRDKKDFERAEFKNTPLPAVWQKKHGDGAQESITYRYALQRIGTELFRKHWNNDTWVISTLSGYQPLGNEYPKGNYMNICSICKKEIFGCQKLCYICPDCWKKYQYPNWIISDVRFLNEINAIRERGGYLIKVERGEKTTSTHASETEMAEYKDWDWVIDNNGSYEDLIRNVKHIMIELDLLKMN